MEMGLRVCWQKLPLEQLLAQNEGLKAFRGYVLTAGRDAYRGELGRRLAEVMERLRQARAQEVLGQLRHLVADISLFRISLERMVLDCAFLLLWENLPAFQAQVEDLARHHLDMEFSYIGPVPPFSFVELVIPWED